MFKQLSLTRPKVDKAAAHHKMISGYFDCRKDLDALDAGTALSDSFEASLALMKFLNTYGCETAEDRAFLAHYDYLQGREDFREMVIEKLGLDIASDKIVVTASVEAARLHLSKLSADSVSKVKVQTLKIGKHEFGLSICDTSEIAEQLSNKALFSPPSTLSQVMAMQTEAKWQTIEAVSVSVHNHLFKTDIVNLFAARHKKEGVYAENVKLFSGTTTALRALGHVFEGKKIGVIKPIYAGYDGDFKASHPEGVSYFETPNLAGDFNPKAIFIWAEKNDVKVLLVNNPNNPTGHLLSKEQIQEVCRLAKETGIDVVFDEINLDSGNFESTPVSALRFQTGNKNVHVVNGIAKTFGFAGFKVGWVISESEAVNAALHNQEAIYYPSVSTLDELHDNLLKDMTLPEMNKIMSDIYIRRQSQYKEFTNWLDQNQVEYIPNDAEGLTLMVNLGDKLNTAQTQSDIELANILFSAYKVFVMPGKSAHFKDSGWFRISYAHKGFIGRFKQILEPRSKL